MTARSARTTARTVFASEAGPVAGVVVNDGQVGTNNSEVVVNDGQVGTNSSEVVVDDSEERATSPAVLASDAERDQVAAQLQHHYTVGRLTLPELEERVAGAHEARTRGQLDALVRDLPCETNEAPSPTYEIDSRLLIILLCTWPPAALVYWLIYYIREKNL